MGALAGYHRVRNRRALTVVMFHRVLAADDPRFAYCDPDYTITTDLFGACLDFFRQHYRVIALDALLAPRPRLPDWPLLITFDDGWSDNAEHALPLLAAAGLPAVLFATSDAIDADEPRAFWQVQLVHAFRRRRLSADRCAELWRESGGDPAAAPPFTTVPCCRALIARLETLTDERLAAVLTGLAPLLAGGPGEQQLLSAHQLRTLAAAGVAVGGHGKSHRPLAGCRDAGRELSESRRVLAGKLGLPAEQAPASMSFPHGSYTPAVLAEASAAGYRAVFTSDPVINAAGRGGTLSPLLGRLAFETADITDEAGRFRPERLANRLFRAPHAALRMEPARPVQVAPASQAAASGG
jgi:peptidoglycan/xylan/chitin deacetylase (PgdA/CDA1 family)